MENELIKNNIKDSYGAIAKNSVSEGCCSDKACCGATDGLSMVEKYNNLEGYVPEADFSLGCGIPTEVAGIEKGNTVIDLGSGAGNDVFIARSIVGPEGKVIGIDMTPEMVIKAWQNNHKIGFQNVEFVLGEIENMPSIPSDIADVVISNCVMNLVPDKQAAFSEVFRVLKEGGHFSISDIVYSGEMPSGVLKAAEMHAGCIAGASEKSEYLGIIKAAGFKNIEIKKQRVIELPDELLLQYLNREELELFKSKSSQIYSITVTADKANSGNCCHADHSSCCGMETDDSGCCENVPQSDCC